MDPEITNAQHKPNFLSLDNLMLETVNDLSAQDADKIKVESDSQIQPRKTVISQYAMPMSDENKGAFNTAMSFMPAYKNNTGR